MNKHVGKVALHDSELELVKTLLRIFDFEERIHLKRRTCDFEYLGIDIESFAGREICEILQNKLQLNVIELRFSYYRPGSYICVHTDNIYKGAYTLTINVSDSVESRLSINHHKVDECEGAGYLMPPETPHEVTIGSKQRVALVAFLSE